MNYRGKKIGITGVDGFLGRALYDRFHEMTNPEDKGTLRFRERHSNNKIVAIDGDIRDPLTFRQIDYTFDYVFHFAAPSSQVLFKRQPLHSAETTIQGFLNVAKRCKEHGVRLVYPSTGLLSQNRENEYARCKKICEDIHIGEGLNALALRIFATYGPGEGHKRDYASVPYLFARDMMAGKSPVIFGDGKQVRDFVYINDVIETILYLAEEWNEPVANISSGEQVSFNDIVKEINTVLGRDIEATYIDKPAGYVQETGAEPAYPSLITTSFREGIKKTIDSLNVD